MVKGFVFINSMLLICTAAYADTTLINGKVPPGVTGNPTFVKQVLNESHNNLSLTTTRNVLNYNTRTKAQIFKYNGQTCVLDGEMTLYADGAEPVHAGTGQCYWIPAGRNVTELNTAQHPTSYLTTFIITK